MKKSNKTYLKFNYYNEKCNSIFQILISKIDFLFRSISCFFTNFQKNFCVPSICLKLNHQIIGVLINNVLNIRNVFVKSKTKQ